MGAVITRKKKKWHSRVVHSQHSKQTSITVCALYKDLQGIVNLEVQQKTPVLHFSPNFLH